jgi:hypothetical protein
MKLWKATLIFLIALTATPALCDSGQVLFREDFKNFSNWEPLYFPKIKEHSTYIVISEKGHFFLKTESHSSASAIIYRRTFNVSEYPHMRWRWKVDNVYKKGDIREKSGDDYPIRVYVLFPYDPKQAGVAERLEYGIAKAIYGQYPPHSTLNYVWTGQNIAERIITSPYTDKAKIIILENGRSAIGTWVGETVNILDDYRAAFGKDPPQTAGIAIMNDSDNTGEAAVSYVEYIEVFR